MYYHPLSAPDGREENLLVGVAADENESPAASSCGQLATQETCICQPNRPGMKLVWVPICDLDEYVDEYVGAGSGKGRREQAEKPNVVCPPVKTLRPQHNISPVKKESMYEVLTDIPNYLTLLNTPPGSSSENAGPHGSPRS